MKPKIRHIFYIIVETLITFLAILAAADWEFTPYVFVAFANLFNVFKNKIEEECEEDEQNKSEESEESSDK